ncbi:hypothetical protein JCM6882_002898 [Rhodosporidiobolus microsporus]
MLAAHLGVLPYRALSPPSPMASPGPEAPPKSVLRVKASYGMSVEWDFELDISREVFVVGEQVKKVPLLGTWTLEIARNEGEDKIKATLRHGPLERDALGEAVDVKMEFQWVDESGEGHWLSDSTWANRGVPDINESTKLPYGGFSLHLAPPPASSVWNSPFRFNPKSQRKYRLVATIERSMPPTPLSVGADLAMRAQGSCRQEVPHDVRIFFPHAHTDGAELWASSSLLAASSPFFRSLFRSHFAESSSRKSRRAREQEDADEVVQLEYPNTIDDSDDETDRYLHFKQPPRLEQTLEAQDLPFYQLNETQTAYSTYEALLVYLETNFVHFAPLTSSCSPLNANHPKRRDAVIQKHQKHPSLPLPVSPKSLYRLAQYLDLPRLEQICLNAIRSSLSLTGAAHELFCDTSLNFHPVRRVVLEYVRENFNEVQKTRSWQEKVRLIQLGELPEAAPVLLDLLQAVSKPKE